MGRYRIVDSDEAFDERAVTSCSEHIAFATQKTAAVGVSEMGVAMPAAKNMVWTCAPRAFEKPRLGKCQAYFHVEKPVPEGWEWGEAAGFVSYRCPDCRLLEPKIAVPQTALAKAEEILDAAIGEIRALGVEAYHESSFGNEYALTETLFDYRLKDYGAEERVCPGCGGTTCPPEGCLHGKRSG